MKMTMAIMIIIQKMLGVLSNRIKVLNLISNSADNIMMIRTILKINRYYK